MNRFGLAIVGCAAIASACAQELVFTPDATLGINVPAPERNRWKARNILPADYDRKASAECREADFFTLEFGKPLELFTLDVTEKGASRLWGERFDAHSGQAIRFGRGWARYDYAHAEVRADIEQAGEGETDWTMREQLRAYEDAKRIFDDLMWYVMANNRISGDGSGATDKPERPFTVK